MNPGLCAECTEARRIVSARGAVYWLCGRSARDPRFVRYPRLPVLACPGFTAGSRAGDEPRSREPGCRELPG